MHPHFGEGEVLQLFSQLQGALGRLRGALLCFRGGSQAQKELPAQLVMVGFVLLNRIAIQGGRIPMQLAVIDELLIFHHRDGLARKLPGRHPFDGLLERVEIGGQGTKSLREWVKIGEIDTELLPVHMVLIRATWE